MAEEQSSTRIQIDSTNTAFMTAFQRGDSAGLAAVYTEDAQLFPPNFPVMEGKQAIQTFWQSALDMGITEAFLETGEFVENGNIAWEVGKAMLKTKEGQIAGEGSYVVIWKREKGAWKWHRDIFNSSRPAQV